MMLCCCEGFSKDMADHFTALIYILDYITDFAVIFTTWDQYLKNSNAYSSSFILYLVGLGIFGISIILRIISESTYHYHSRESDQPGRSQDQDQAQNQDEELQQESKSSQCKNLCSNLFCRCISVIQIFWRWPYIFLFKAFRVALIPFDCVLSMGYNSGRTDGNIEDLNRCANSFLRIKMVREEEGEYFDQLFVDVPLFVDRKSAFGDNECDTVPSLLGMYFQMVASLMGGGRWIAIALHRVGDNNTDKYGQWLGMVIILEELSENVGGIIMSLVPLVYGSYDGIAVFSIIMAVISFMYETATYIAILDNWKAGGQEYAPTVNSIKKRRRQLK